MEPGMQAPDDRAIGLHDGVEESGGEPMKDGMRWRGALYGLASSAREGRSGHMTHMTMMTTGAVGEARDGGASSPAETAVSGLNISSKHVQKVQVFLSKHAYAPAHGISSIEYAEYEVLEACNV
jgi:hypothetical protein